MITLTFLQQVIQYLQNMDEYRLQILEIQKNRLKENGWQESLSYMSPKTVVLNRFWEWSTHKTYSINN
jgi:hypothetical protein